VRPVVQIFQRAAAHEQKCEEKSVRSRTAHEG
jgi:hypothetical protein